MKDREILTVKTDETSLAIVDDILFIGSPYDDSDHPDLCFQFEKEELVIDGWKLSKAQLLTLKMFLNNDY